MFTIIFKCEGEADHKAFADEGANLLELAQANDVPIDAPCNGNGTCGKCRVRLMAGTVETHKNPKLSDEDFADDWRLACQSTVLGDATLWVPAGAADFKKGIQTADLSTPEELERYHKGIQAIFDAGIKRGREQQGVGVAVDIGSTTVTAALLDLKTGDILGKASSGNGQIRFGADVINRIIQQTKPGGKEKLMHAVREETLYPIIDELCKQGKIDEQDIEYFVISGNTTMEHLFVGADGNSIRLEPYEPAFLEMRDKTAGDLGLPYAPDAPVVLSPNVGSYVGGDITAGVLATLMWTTSDKVSLFIDLGTNGELVMGNADYMFCCACSAGPAFEGGDITCGMRATNGAIESCTIDSDTMEPTFGIVGEPGTKPVGMCGSGLIDVIAELFRTGIIDASGKFARDGERVRRDEWGGAEYVLAFADKGEAGTKSDVTINETDIDSFVRAKGAIFSAIRTMCGAVDMHVADIDQVIIAGGIGSGINMENAMRIGMLPKMDISKYSYIGNSSLTGSCAMLLSSEAEQKVFDLAHNMTYLELSTYPGYMDEFVAACFLPHTDASLFA